MPFGFEFIKKTTVDKSWRWFVNVPSLTTISLGDLEQWCLNNRNPPTEEDEPYVISYQIDYNDEFDDDKDVDADDESQFRFVDATRRLLRIASHKATHLMADATYKCNWNGFPVLIIGTSDANKTFLSFCIAVCENEKTKDFQFMFQALQDGIREIGETSIRLIDLIDL